MSASEGPHKLSEVLSALDDSIEYWRRERTGPPVDLQDVNPLAWESLDDLVPYLEHPLTPKDLSALKIKIACEHHEIRNRPDSAFKLPDTFKGPEEAGNIDPTAEAPVGSKDFWPLKIVARDPDFPPDYVPKRPRLIDVVYEPKFNSITDCERLRPMDAIVTILHHDSPELLTKLMAKVQGNEMLAKFDRSTGWQERFDIVIQRSSGSLEEVTLSLFEKIDKDGPPERMKEAYIEALYRLGGEKPWIEVDPKEWNLVRVGGTCWDDMRFKDMFSRFKIETPNEDEYRGRCLARYLLLLRPWKEKAGVKIQRIIRTENPDNEYIPRPRSEEDDWSFYPLVIGYDGKEKVEWDAYSVVDPGAKLPS